jgi:phage terminase small subunit
MPKNDNDLKDKQQMFADLYLSNGNNGKQAYIGAGYSPKGAESCSSRLLRNDKVAAYISKRQLKVLTKLRDKYEINEDSIMNELACIGFLDIGDMFDDEGNVLPIRKIPEKARRAIIGMDVAALYAPKSEGGDEVGQLKKIKISDKRQALEALGKIIGMFKDKVELSGKDGKDLIPEQNDTDTARRIAFILRKEMEKRK